MNYRKFILAGILLSIGGLSACSPPKPVVLLMNYPEAASSGCTVNGFLGHGYFIPQYPGSSLSQMIVYLGAARNGPYTLQMTSHSGTFDGPIIGTSTAYASLSSVFLPVTFVYGSNPQVSQDSALMFTPALIAGESVNLFMDCSSLPFGNLNSQQINLAVSANLTPPFGSGGPGTGEFGDGVLSYGFAFLLYGNP